MHQTLRPTSNRAVRIPTFVDAVPVVMQEISQLAIGTLKMMTVKLQSDSVDLCEHFHAEPIQLCLTHCLKMLDMIMIK